MGSYASTIFLSSYLLFQVQPLIARYILPRYGGSPAVWTACMLFFQVLLMGGYAYVHALGKLDVRKQVGIHLTLLIVSLMFLPIGIDAGAKVAYQGGAVAQIFFLLTVSIGAPYLLVSSSAPLLQNWSRYSHPSQSPYRLYALSNLGSLLGLLLYPFLVEPLLPLGAQSTLWSIGYMLYVAFCGWCAIRLARSGTTTPTSSQSTESRTTRVATVEAAVGKGSGFGDRLLWLLLAACGSVTLLATTNQMCQDVAVVPFLWILPLSLYLISFIICFNKEVWYRRWVWVPVFLLALGVVIAELGDLLEDTGLPVRILIYSVALFTACMVCHGELARRKPGAKDLTTFYLIAASGGALGGAFVGLVAPRLFNGYWEFPLGLLGTYVLAGLCIFWRTGRTFIGGRFALHLWAGGIWILLLSLIGYTHREQEGALVMERNFFGVLRVVDGMSSSGRGVRYLWHGQIKHGGEYLSEKDRSRPIMYYGPESGIGVALQSYRHQQRSTGLRIGVVGLGAGTIAAYGRAGDLVRFYEINPEVVRIAEKYFHYLGETPARVEIVLGDARMSLEQELEESGSQRFDILALDAFSGDAIPVHLLTREAFSLYQQHLHPDGILAVHITNLHLDLGPVVRNLAEEMGSVALAVERPKERRRNMYYSRWVLVTKNETFLQSETVQRAIVPWPPNQLANVIWTDDYSNLFRVLKD